jgi:VanZ family protein
MTLSKRLSQLHLTYLPAVLWAGLIFWFSAQPALPNLADNLADFFLKKTAHFLIYAGLYFWLWWANSVRSRQPKTAFLQLLICFMYACSDELHQSFTEGRHPTVRDVGIDMLGATVMASLLHHYQQWPVTLKQRLAWLIPS